MEPLHLVWGLSDLFNALMAVPNLLSLLLLADTVAGRRGPSSPGWNAVEHSAAAGAAPWPFWPGGGLFSQKTGEISHKSVAFFAFGGILILFGNFIAKDLIT